MISEVVRGMRDDMRYKTNMQQGNSIDVNRWLVRFLAVIVILIVLTSPMYAGRYAGDFMAIGAGVKPLSMGGAFVALADNGNAVYWNPAGIAMLRKVEVNLMHAFMYGDLAYYDNLTYIQPLPNGVSIGLNWTRLTVEDIPRFEEKYLVGTNIDQRSMYPELHLPGTPDGRFSSADDLFQFGFAKNVHLDVNLGWEYFRLPVDLNFGSTIKYIKRDLDTNLGTGTGFDFGFQGITDLAILLDVTWLGELAVGMNYKDIGGTKITWDTESDREDEVLSTFNAGAALIQPIPRYDTRFVFEFDVMNQYSEVHRYGLEVIYKNLISVRLGYFDEQFTGGVGLTFYNLTLNYAFLTNTLGNTNRLGIGFHY